MKNVNDAFIYNAFPVSGTEAYLKISGEETKNISLENNNFKHTKTPVVTEGKVTEEVRVISGDPIK